MAADLVRIAARERCRAVLIAGDVKHPIVGTPPALRRVVFDFFSTLLSEDLEVEVVLGNHDVGLEPHVPREVRIHPASGLVRDGVGLFHGHRWPSAAVLRAPRLVVGHLHPGLRLAPTGEHGPEKQRGWVRVSIDPAPPTKRRPPRVRAREVVVLPAFNPLAGVESLNREKPRRGRSFLFRRFVLLGRARMYLLDGTDVGEVVSPRSPGPSGSPPRARSRRRSAVDTGH